jgi:hypothetical protein
MGRLKNYNCGQVQVVAGVRTLSGFAPDSIVSVDFDEDSFEAEAGSDGEVTRSVSKNQMATITVKLMQSSDSNDILAAFWASDQAGGAGVFPIMVKDGSGRSLYVGEQAWVQKLPAGDFEKKAKDREWKIRVASLTAVVGGN